MDRKTWGALAAEERVEWLTAAWGLAGAIAAGAWLGASWGLGVALGAGLAWANFRWLKQGVYAMAAAIAEGKARRRAGRYWLRLVVIGAALCAIFVVHLVAFLAVLGGLLTAPAAILVEAGCEVAQGFRGGRAASS